MALHMPTFLKRTGSAIVFGIIMLGGLLWNEFAFIALAALIQVLCLHEYLKLVKKITPNAHHPFWLPLAIQATGLAFLLGTFYAVYGDNYLPALFCLPVLLVLLISLNEKPSMATAFQCIAGLVYIVTPLALLSLMRIENYMLPLGLILMIWMNDTMAYIVGSFIGKTPFSPISPKKTWEGTAGGAILTVAGAGIYGYFSTQYHIYDWMALALCAAVAGTAGDLLESRLKRLADVKDSGAIMPGHGGALDRFDSLLVAAPFAYAYCYLFL
jgi:phosphatidate cytidylyltransferase